MTKRKPRGMGKTTTKEAVKISVKANVYLAYILVVMLILTNIVSLYMMNYYSTDRDKYKLTVSEYRTDGEGLRYPYSLDIDSYMGGFMYGVADLRTSSQIDHHAGVIESVFGYLRGYYKAHKLVDMNDDDYADYEKWVLFLMYNRINVEVVTRTNQTVTTNVHFICR